MSTIRPNFLLLIGEDTGLHLGCYGHSLGTTPNLDRLAAQGYRYLHAISTAPVCAPSRCSIVTGQYPWSLGTHLMRCTLTHPPRLVTHELRDAGYHVNWWTKTDFNFEPPADFADRTDDWVQNLAQGKLPDQPWLLFRNFGVTHESTMWNRVFNGDHGAAWERKANLSLLARGERRAEDMVVPDYLPDTPEVRADLARYYDALEIQDAQIGKVLAALEASPYADNTIVVYMTDHGRGLIREKRWCYDAGLHLPLIIRVPEKWRDHAGIKAQPGGTVDTLVNWVDIAPTLLSLAGVAIPQQYQGQAFLGPACAGKLREAAFAGRDRMDETFDRVRVARDRQYHYIRNYHPELPYAQRNLYMERQATTEVTRRLHAAGALQGSRGVFMSAGKPAEELYDAVADPMMVHNLADEPAKQAVLVRLRKALDEHLAKVGDHGATTESELVAKGIVTDRITEYRSRIEPLPAEYQIGPPLTIFELKDALAYKAQIGG